MKTAIVVLSDPKSDSEESLGRLFNALAVAYDYKNNGGEVEIFFQGTGTRWPEQLQDENHPAYDLFKEVEDEVAGVSCGCADVFDADPSGFDLIKTNEVPGTTGLPSLNKLHNNGYHVLTF